MLEPQGNQAMLIVISTQQIAPVHGLNEHSTNLSSGQRQRRKAEICQTARDGTSEKLKQ